MDSKGYYKILGVSENASESDIKKAFKKASLKYHPDRQAGKSEKEVKEAEENFKLANTAYSVLTDKTKRANYDRFGEEEGNTRGFSASEGWDFTGGFPPFEDMFSMFGGNPFGHQQRRPRQKPVANGTDIRMSIPLTLEEIYNGCTKKLKYERYVRCKNCHGDGGSGRQLCHHCQGTGMIMDVTRHGSTIIQSQKQCPHCHGEGYTVDHICPTCHGNGLVKETKVIEVVFPAGMPNNFAIDKESDGNESKDRNGHNGHFYAIAEHKYDKDRFSIKNLDVTERITLPYYDLLLGTEYTFSLPNGEERKINIPSCIKDGSSIKLYRDGIKGNNDLVGDYYIEVHYAYPSEINQEERIKLEDIKVINYKKNNNTNYEEFSV